MTLLDFVPSLGSGAPVRLAPAVWPPDTHYDTEGGITLGGVALTELADRFGTPCYVLDEAEIRRRCRAYLTTFPEATVVYAAKALLTRAVAEWVTEEGVGLDVCSGGELAIALAAGVAPERIVLHGNGKTMDELRTAVRARVGRIVVDSTAEITLLSALPAHDQRLLLRLAPGIEAGGHPAIRTGGSDHKFGLSGTAVGEAVQRIGRSGGLRLVGLHCHLGSQIHDPDHYGEAVRRLVARMAAIRDEHGLLLTELDLGGGHAVAYRPGDAELNLAELADVLADALDVACARHRFPRPRLLLEPGRAIVARAGVTLYRVLAVKENEAGRRYAIVDGGMGDNPRVALYGARYDAVVAGRHRCGPQRGTTVAGRYCESGDIIATDIRLPADLRAGEVLAVPCTGAYHHSLASTYNGIGRPPIVAVRDGSYREIVRRETVDDLLAREV
ncbi:diaminopimelate decarboxylase [Nocardia sp. NPDC057353]|uniref:diaminopimelate decarboxylase n=1 Tax=Nocardia sp. NPDC057353 TaxID=3346104 RepID=UPI003624D012